MRASPWPALEVRPRGDSAIFEFLGGQLKIHHGWHDTVMTNSPPSDTASQSRPPLPHTHPAAISPRHTARPSL